MLTGINGVITSVAFDLSSKCQIKRLQSADSDENDAEC